MIVTHQEYFECIIPSRNRFAFYELIAGRDLFGPILIRRWGRIGTKGQPILQVRFANQEELLKTLKTVRKERLKKQYQLITGKQTKPGKKKTKKICRQPRKSESGPIQPRLF